MMNEEAGPFFAEFQAPFGDRVYNFRMDLVGIRELQEKTDAGPAFLVTRIVGLQYKVDDLRETIRIALWRGGTDPVRAQVLMERYFDSGPVDRHANSRPAFSSAFCTSRRRSRCRGRIWRRRAA
jgi:hypothetical protein